MYPFTVLTKLSPFHFTSLFIFVYLFNFFTYPINPSLHFTLLFISTTHFPSLHFPSLFTFYRLHFPSMVFTFLTLVLKICVLPWEVPIAPSGSLFQAVMDLFTKEYIPMSLRQEYMLNVFENRVLRNIFRPKTGGRVTMTSFLICVSHQIFSGLSNQENWDGCVT
jgi:hypothetical protein